jgi:potassium efflux system protein
LAEKQLRWDSDGLASVRRNLRWLAAVGLPALFLNAAMEGQPNQVFKDSLGRLSFLILMVALAVAVGRIFRTRRGKRTVWGTRLHRTALYLGVAIPLLLGLVALAGYYYTARELTYHLLTTVWLGLGALVLHQVLLRCLFVARRRLALAQAQLRREAELTEAGPEAEQPQLQPAEREMSIQDIGVQTRKLLGGCVAVVVVLCLWAIWSRVLPALAFFNNVTVWSDITLANLLVALGLLVITVLAARNIPGMLEITALRRLPLDAGVRFAITTVCKYTISVIGIVLVFTSVGLTWSKVQWLVAAMTVGLGFGLQEIFANFISGLIILFERPMRVGDTVTVGDITGTVTRIQIRATTIVDWDRKELVVPNREFITGRLVNWTLSDRILRVVVTVGIEYGSDTDLAVELLLAVARENPDVLDEPEPTVVFTEFGDSSLSFQLRVFVPSVEVFLQVRHQLHMAIDKAFRDAGITIAFPQRDVHIRTVEQALPINQAREAD